MDVFTMVVVIVVVSVSAGVLNNYMKVKGRQDAAEQDSATLEELDELRQRVEVLEKIVTDKQYQLRSELAELERNGH
ncbi:MAG: hypothetical protein RIC89_09385 [Pseudomonadales bacterium]